MNWIHETYEAMKCNYATSDLLGENKYAVLTKKTKAHDNIVI